MPDFLPRREVELLNWSANFSQRVNADPEAVGVPQQLAEDYAALHLEFATVLRLSTEPRTRTRPTNVRKREVMKQLKAAAREMARLVRAHPGLTDTQRVELKLRVPSEPRRRVPAPASRPTITIRRIVGRTVTVRLHEDAAPTLRGRPRGTVGAMMSYYVGENPPATIGQWEWACTPSRVGFRFEFPPDVPPGTKVWLTGCWIGTRLERGPLANPVSTHVGFALNANDSSACRAAA